MSSYDEVQQKLNFRQRGANRGCGDKYLESFYTIIWVSLTFLCDRAKQYIFIGNNNFFCYRIVLHIFFSSKIMEVAENNFKFSVLYSAIYYVEIKTDLKSYNL